MISSLSVHVLRGVPVLRRRDVVSNDLDGVVRLSVEKRTFEQRAQIRAACEGAIGRFLAARGLAVWDNRLLELEPVPESIRYEALKRDGRCLLCGATKDDERLEAVLTRVLTKTLATCGTDGNHEPLP